MTIKAPIRHLVVVETNVELPNVCPHCGELLNFGGRITKLYLGVDGAVVEVNEGKLSDESYGVNVDREIGEGHSDVVAYACTKCRELLVGWHRRTWVLDGMDPALASQLKTLLYDSNVLDEDIRKKVFGQ